MGPGSGVRAPGGDGPEETDQRRKVGLTNGALSLHALADDAAMRAWACVKTAEDTVAVHAAVRCVYLPWLEDTARHFQQCLEAKPLPTVVQQEGVEVDIVFYGDSADALIKAVLD